VIRRKSPTASQVFRWETGGPVVGLLQQCYQQESFTVESGDLIVLFTRPRRRVGRRSIDRVRQTCQGLPAFEAMTRILAAAEAFAAGASQHDDMTPVVLRILA